MIRLPVNLPDELHEHIRQEAFKKKCSMSDIIRKAVSDYVSKDGQEEMVKHIKLEVVNDPNEVREEMMKKIGRLK